MKRIAAMSLLLFLSVLLFVSVAESRRSQAAASSANISVTKVNSPDPVNGIKPDLTVTVNNNGPEPAANVSCTTEFVTRSRFTAAYPNTLTAARFVDMLFANAGVVPADLILRDEMN